MLRSAARRAFRMLPQNSALPILSGANRGRRWIIGAGLVRCWLGTYEAAEVAIFISLLKPADVMWDIGAHAGYFTLACAGRVRHVVACEAATTNVARLRRHLMLNRIDNVSVVQKAISNTDGALVSFGGEDSYQGQIGSGAETIATATIDGLVASGLSAPSIIKMDIEGSEALALAGARETLLRHRPTIMLAVHSDALRHDCSASLAAIGYDVAELNVGTLLAKNVKP